MVNKVQLYQVWNKMACSNLPMPQLSLCNPTKKKILNRLEERNSAPLFFALRRPRLFEELPAIHSHAWFIITYHVCLILNYKSSSLHADSDSKIKGLTQSRLVSELGLPWRGCYASNLPPPSMINTHGIPSKKFCYCWLRNKCWFKYLWWKHMHTKPVCTRQAQTIHNFHKYWNEKAHLRASSLSAFIMSLFKAITSPCHSPQLNPFSHQYKFSNLAKTQVKRINRNKLGVFLPLIVTSDILTAFWFSKIYQECSTPASQRTPIFFEVTQQKKVTIFYFLMLLLLLLFQANIYLLQS